MNKTHKKSRTPTYATWVSMKDRCLRPAAANYRFYGGKGITVCDRWRESFENFYEDMGERPAGMTLDRIDPSNGYSPENCRWATNHEQAANRSDTCLITAFGETKSCDDWGRDPRCVVTGVAIRRRVRLGMSPETAITKPGQPTGDRSIYRRIRSSMTNVNNTARPQECPEMQAAPVAVQAISAVQVAKNAEAARKRDEVAKQEPWDGAAES